MEATETRNKVSTHLEKWAAHFGSIRERRSGRRVLEFNEFLSDVAEEVSWSLDVLPDIMEFAAIEGWCSTKASGFCMLTTLTVEATQKTLNALVKEVRTLESCNAALRKEIESANAKIAETAPQVGSDNGLSGVGTEALGGRPVVDGLELVPTAPQAEVDGQE